MICKGKSLSMSVNITQLGLKSSIWKRGNAIGITHSVCVIYPVVTLPEIALVFVNL